MTDQTPRPFGGLQPCATCHFGRPDPAIGDHGWTICRLRLPEDLLPPERSMPPGHGCDLGRPRPEDDE